MTAKEALLQRVQSLTEEQAEALLRELPAEDKPSSPEGNFWDWLEALWADVPAEAWENVPTSEDIDHVVYGIPKPK